MVEFLRYFEDVGGDHWTGECFVFRSASRARSFVAADYEEVFDQARQKRNAVYLEWLAAHQDHND